MFGIVTSTSENRFSFLSVSHLPFSGPRKMEVMAKASFMCRPIGLKVINCERERESSESNRKWFRRHSARLWTNKNVFAFGGVRVKNGKIEIKQKFDRLLSLIKRFRFEKWLRHTRRFKKKFEVSETNCLRGELFSRLHLRSFFRVVRSLRNGKFRARSILAVSRKARQEKTLSIVRFHARVFHEDEKKLCVGLRGSWSVQMDFPETFRVRNSSIPTRNFYVRNVLTSNIVANSSGKFFCCQLPPPPSAAN